MNQSLIRRFVLGTSFLVGQLLFAQSDIDHSYLGVHTSRLAEGVRHQLGLPKGLHLQVERVAPGSPAENAGVKLYDVLLKFDDQILINPEQLKTLVRMHNPGERVSLSILRQSKPISLTVELVEAPETARDSYDHQWMDDRDPFDFDHLLGPNNRFKDFFRRHSFDFPDIRNFHRRPFFFDPRLDSSVPEPSGGGTLDDPLHGNPADDADVQSYSYSSSTQQITVSDEHGIMQWTEKDGLRFLRATDLDGRVLFEGAITTEEDREKMPEGVGERLRAMQISGQIPYK
ncbi:MAG: PDZ domain-containing protein [Opitutae bacterium]